jgi:hypothetical protein
MRDRTGLKGIAGAVLVAGALLAPARPAAAQWGGFGFGGYGGWGWGGYGGIGSMGMSLYDQNMIKEQTFMENSARYNMMNAQAVQSFASANLMQQQAANTMLQNQMMAQQIAQDKFNLYSKAKNQAMAQARAAAPEIPLGDLIDSSGRVRWPEAAPSMGAHAERRAAADEAIQTVYTDFRQNGRANLAAVVEGKRRLHAYGEPAIRLLAARNDNRARSNLIAFLNALEAALDAMGAGPPAGENAGPDAGGNAGPDR